MSSVQPDYSGACSYGYKKCPYKNNLDSQKQFCVIDDIKECPILDIQIVDSFKADSMDDTYEKADFI